MSITSAILTVHSQQVPLCIDPHQQAESWLRFKLAHGLCVVSATESSMLRVVQQCAKVGAPCLVTSVSNRLDPALLPFVSRTDSVTAAPGTRGHPHSATKDSSLTHKARTGHAPGFELYLTTQLAEPRFAASTTLSVSVINFAAFQAVWEQFLVDTVRHEKPSLEASAEASAAKLASDTRALKNHEENTLQLLQVNSLIIFIFSVEMRSCEPVSQRCSKVDFVQHNLPRAFKRSSVLYPCRVALATY